MQSKYYEMLGTVLVILKASRQSTFAVPFQSLGWFVRAWRAGSHTRVYAYTTTRWFLWPCCTPCWQTCQDRIPYSGASGICASWCFEFVAVLGADMGMPLLQDDASACRPDDQQMVWRIVCLCLLPRLLNAGVHIAMYAYYGFQVWTFLDLGH